MDNKPREMTLAAIRKRFDVGSWDHADLVWLYKKADDTAELLEVLERAATFIGECLIDNELGEDVQPLHDEMMRVIRNARGGEL